MELPSQANSDNQDLREQQALHGLQELSINNHQKQKGQNREEQEEPKQTEQRGQREEEEQGEEERQEGEEDEEEEMLAGGKWQKVEEPEQQLPLFMVDFEHCDSKKCTGKKMERFKLLTKIKDKKKKFRGVVLSAYGKKFISRQDLEHITKGGICVIDCSWNRIEETREFRYKHERKLPFVVAGNPVNFGKPYQLSCVEALATALCAVGFLPQAKFIMSKFGWADGFWQQNPHIGLYANCLTPEQLQQQSRHNEEIQVQGFQRNYDLGSDPEQEQEQGGEGE